MARSSKTWQKVYSSWCADMKGWSFDEKFLALYLLTNEHATTEGLYRLPLVYAADDLEWAAERLSGALGLLTARGWAMYEREWMLVVKRLRYDAPAGPKQLKGALRMVEQAPRPSAIWTAFLAAADAAGRGRHQHAHHAAAFAAELRAAYPLDTPSEPLANSSDGAADRIEPDRGTGFENPPPSLADQDLSDWYRYPFDCSSSTSSSTTSSSSTTGGGAAELDTAVFEALGTAGYDRLSVEQDASALRLLLVDIAGKQDLAAVDWPRAGALIAELRAKGSIKRGRPVSGLKFLANSASGLPKIGEKPSQSAAASLRRQRSRERDARTALAMQQSRGLLPAIEAEAHDAA